MDIYSTTQGIWPSVFFGLALVWGASAVAGTAPVITSQPTNQVTVADDATVTLTVTATGATGCQWFKNGTALVGATDATLNVTDADVTKSGIYYAALTNADGTTITSPSRVCVGDSPLQSWGRNGHGELGWGQLLIDSRCPGVVASNAVWAGGGGFHSLFVTSGGTLWAMGWGAYGQLGVSNILSVSLQTTNRPIVVASNVIWGAGGRLHSLFIKEDGTLWGMGNNEYGQLGNGSIVSSVIPVYATNNVVLAVGSDFFSFFITNDGSLWSMGLNTYGQLGDGTTTSRQIPVFVTNNVVSAAAGNAHGLFIRSDGTLWSMGRNTYGQLGDGTTINRLRPVCVASNVISVSAAGAGDHTVFVQSDGKVWTVGHNNYGQLGDGTLVDRSNAVCVSANAISAAAGNSHTVFTKSDGVLWSMGYNEYGELGCNNTSALPSWPKPIHVFIGRSAGAGPCSEHSLAVAYVKTPPIISDALTNQTLVVGQTLTFAPGFSGDTPIYAQWSTNGVPLVGATNVSYSVQSVTVASAATYTLTLFSPYGSDSSSAIVTVNKATPTLTPPVADAIKLGRSLANSTLIRGSAVNAYSGAVVAGTFTFLDPDFTPSSAGTTNVWIKFTPADLSNYNAANIQMPIQVFLRPEIIAQPANSLAVASGEPMTLSVSAGDAVGSQWFKNGAALAGATNTILSFASADVSDSGIYYIALTNANGTTLSNPSRVCVGGSPLLAWGRNTYGQLGLGTTANTNRPVVVASNAVWAATGGGHTVFVTTDGTLWGVGYNGYSQLGIGTQTDTNATPVVVTNETVWAVAGGNHSLFIKEDGTLWSVGYNNYGQLGVGGTAMRTTPIYVTNSVVFAAAGSGHSLFVRTDGSLWAMGRNNYGQLGDGSLVTRSTPVLIATNVVSAAAGNYHSLFVKADGTLWSVGYNNYGQLGDGTLVARSNAACVASGVLSAASGQAGDHAVFVKTDGTLWAMGRNTYGQLGDGTFASRSNAVLVASSAVSAAGGSTHTVFVKPDGTLWAMGQNMYGQLGNSRTVNSNLPTRVFTSLSSGAGPGSDFSVAVGLPAVFSSVTPTVTNQTVQMGGAAVFSAAVSGDSPQYFQWLRDGIAIPGATAAVLSIPSAAVSDAGTYSLVAWNDWGGVTTGRVATLSVNFAVQPVDQTVATDGTVTLSVDSVESNGYQWFKNGSALAGATHAELLISHAAVADSGVYYVVATNALNGISVSQPSRVSVGGSPLLVWGYNAYGQLGNNTAANTNRPIIAASNVVAAAAGALHTVYIKSDGTLWAAGDNSYGQQGDTAATNNPSPIFVSSNTVWTSAGQSHTVFVKDDGTLWAMGLNSGGQLGDGTTVDRTVPVYVTNDVVAAAAGSFHTVFLRKNGTLWAIGTNNISQLGDGTTTSRKTPVLVTNNAVSVAAGFNHTLCIRADGTLWGFGGNTSGKLGDGTSTTRKTPIYVTNDVLSAAAGYNHTLFVKSDGTLWAMGQNTYGQLGDGTTTTRMTPILVSNNVDSVSLGYNHTLFVKSDGTLWAMGQNSYGQLGNGSSANALRPVRVSASQSAGAGFAPCGSHSVAVGLPPMAPAIVSLTNQSLVVGQRLALVPGVSGDAPLFFQWRTNGVALAGATNAGYSVAAVAVSSAATFTLTATNLYGTAAASATVTVSRATPALALPAASVIERGQSLADSVLTGGAATNAYSGWVVAGAFSFSDPSLTPGATGTTNVWVVFTPADTISYTLASNLVSVTVVQGNTTGSHPTPIDWLTRYGIDGTGAAAENADSDGDGYANWQEYIAGTDPTNALSRLEITAMTHAVTASDTSATIVWWSMTGRVYAVQAIGDLTKTNWSVLAGASCLTGAVPSMAFTDTTVSAASNRFYRIEARLP